MPDNLTELTETRRRTSLTVQTAKIFNLLIDFASDERQHPKPSQNRLRNETRQRSHCDDCNGRRIPVRKVIISEQLDILNRNLLTELIALSVN